MRYIINHDVLSYHLTRLLWNRMDHLMNQHLYYTFSLSVQASLKVHILLNLLLSRKFLPNKKKIMLHICFTISNRICFMKFNIKLSNANIIKGR